MLIKYSLQVTLLVRAMGAQWQGWCSLLFLLISCYQWRCSHAQPDVYLELRSTNLTNNTVVLISDIGDTDYPLICNTNLNPCCAHIDNRLGEWYYPNGSALHIKGGGSSIYRTRRDAGSGVPGGALLHRRHNVMGPAGIYRCTIPDANSMDQTLYVGLYTSATNGAQLDSINFELTSGAAVMVTYSLTCVSNGGPISTMQWEKDDVTINNASIYPSLTDAAMSTYTNTLQETGREPGVYTCIATDGGTLSLSQSLMVAAANPPTAVMASLDATSGNVLISLTQPVGGATVTGYRIYYSVGGSQTSELFTTAENEFMLDLKGASSLDDMMISIRAESAQLPSELVLVNVTAPVVESTTAMEVPSATTTGPPSPSIAVDVTANLSTPLMVGQTGYTLTCDVSGADNLNATITYEWTTNGETVSDVSSNTLDLSPLMLSDAGDYTCNVTVGSALLTSDIQASANNTQTVTVDIPDPQSVTVTSSDNVISSGSSITVTCTVELDSAILDSELSLLMVDAQLSRDGTPLTLANSTVTGTTFNFTTTVSSFSESDVGNYTCTATIRPQPSSQYLTGMGQRQSSSFEITIAVVTVEPTIATETTTGQPIESITDISITSSGTNTAGESYSLECSVTVTGSTDQPTVTWMDNGTEISSTTDRMVSGISSSAGSYSTTLTFSPLRASDVGIFKCIATLGNVTNSQIFNVAVQVPNPSVTISSNPSSPIIAGSSVTVICTVELNQYVDVGLTVNVTWTGPAGVAISPTDPLMENTTRYTSAVMFSSFGRQQSGEYTCSATISSDTLMTSGIKVSGMENITVGVYLSLKGVVYANNSVIPITEIGETNSTSNTGLQCITDRRPCCLSTPNRLGHWQFPNKTTVGISGTSTSFYRNRRDDGTVNLNRVDVSVMMPTGQFCCIVRDATDVDQTVCANIVSYTIVITPNGTLTVGQTYSLDCSLTGTADTVTYQWFDNNGTQLTDVSQLEFSLLRASDVGLYTCRATVGGVVVMETTTVTISLPAPTAVTVTPPVGVIIAGSSPILTCTVELSPAVDVPVNVSTEWSSPDMTMVTTTSSMMESLTRYTIMANVDAARNGSYTCRASIDSSSQFITGSGMTSGPITVTVASLPAPTALMVSSPTSTSISLTWEQPLGASAVDTYEIIYDRIVNECGGDIGSYPTVTVIVDNGSLRSYTLTNSSSTPVEEDSRYFITLRAVNSVTRSEAKMAFPNPITTRDAAPGLVQSLRVGSVDVTNITIQWDRVNCVDRNGGIDSYFVSFYPTSNPNEDDAQTILGTGDSDRMLSITALPPLTSYTFEVEANNPRIRDPGAIATITVSTTVPQDLEFLLSGQLYPNNSLVTLGSDSVLYCLTPSTECCGSSVSGEWYLPDGTAVSSSTAPFSRSQVPSAVSLRRGSSTPPSGVFRCEIPDASGTGQNIYVGIYPPQGDGSPSITSVLLDRNLTTLTCTSTGGPPTTVTWRKDGQPINETLYEQSQRLVNAETATYENVLSSNTIANFVGSFTCEVSNARGSNTQTTELNGVTIVRDQFSVGSSAMARCSSDNLAARMEWLNNEVVVASAFSTQQLSLVFSPVNDSIHNQVYVCRVTRDGENGMPVTAVQNFTANVDVPPTVLTSTVSSLGTARAGMVYNLTCNVSKTVDGLINFPTAAWTTGGEAVTDGNGITVSTMSTDAANFLTLTFDPLRTSHDGRYSCDGTLTSPALKTELMLSTVETLQVQISTPDVVITVPPGPLFAGSIDPLILTCTISINTATDTDVSVTDTDVTWLRGSMHLSDSDSGVTISAVSGSRPSFTSTLTLDPLSIVDNATFTCQARARRPITQHGFISDSEIGEGINSVMVDLPSLPTVSIVRSSDSVTAGEPLTLTCSATVQEGIEGTPILTWTRNSMELSGEEHSGSLVLSFSPIIRDAGEYTCTARLTIPEAGVDVSGTNTASIVVQVPPPTITVGSREDDDGLCSKITTLNCAINKTYYGIDTEPTFSWLAPDGSVVSSEERANPQVDIQNIQLIFSDITTARSGVYMCQINVASNNMARTSVYINRNVPDVPQGLSCASPSSPSELTLSWNPPSMLQGDKISYIVDVNALSHKSGTRDVIQSDIINRTTDMQSENIQNLVAEVPYNVTVKALNLVGCGEEQQIYCFTQEGQPPAPENLTVAERNTTSIKFCWKRFTLVELMGLGNYTINYRPSGTSGQAATTVSVPWTENCTTIHNLTPGVEYEIAISVSLMTRTSSLVRTSAVTTSVPDVTGNNTPIVIIIVVVVVALLIIVILLALISICAIWRKHHRDELKLENSKRMVRVFEEPMILNGKERQSMDVEKEQEEITLSELQEKPPPASTGECELVQTPVHVPSTFTAPKEADPTTTPAVISNGDGPS